MAMILSSALGVHDFIKMALHARLLGKSVFGCHGLRPILATQIRPITMQSRPATAPIEEGHDERNMRLKRPLSPHITIYYWQLPPTLSITHRFTGIILSGYATTFAAISLLSSKPMCEIIANISRCYPEFFAIFKVGLIFPFTYHFFNGIRHLIWDTGHALSMKGVYITGYLMILCSLLATGGLIYFAEESKRIARELKRQAEEAAAKAKELAEQNAAKGKKKK